MQKALFFLFSFLFCYIRVSAQQKVLSGYIKDSSTHLPIAGATLSKPADKKKVQTDANGFFRLPVSPDDLLYAIAVHYRYDTLRYSVLFQDTITIYLAPVNVLETVTIETGYRKYQMDSIERRQEFEKARGQTLNTVDGSSSKPYFGLTLNLDRIFKKKYRNKKKDEESFTRLEQHAYVKYRFSPQLVAFYTGLKGDALAKFMQLYTPSYDWLRQHLLKEQLLDYLGEKLTDFRKLVKNGG